MSDAGLGSARHLLLRRCAVDLCLSEIIYRSEYCSDLENPHGSIDCGFLNLALIETNFRRKPDSLINTMPRYEAIRALLRGQYKLQ